MQHGLHTLIIQYNVVWLYIERHFKRASLNAFQKNVFLNQVHCTSTKLDTPYPYNNLLTYLQNLNVLTDIINNVTNREIG